MIPSIVLLGNLLVDDVVCGDGTTRMEQAGGALLYCALGATLWASRPGLVSVLGNDYPAPVLGKLHSAASTSPVCSPWVDQACAPGCCMKETRGA